VDKYIHELREAKELDVDVKKFIRELRAAKKRGVDVVGIFVEVEEEIWLGRVKVFGLFMSIVSVFLTPSAIILIDLYCAMHHVNILIPRDLAYWLCGMGFVSILAFGYDLVDIRRYLPSFLQKALTPVEEQRITLQLLPIHADDADQEGELDGQDV